MKGKSSEEKGISAKAIDCLFSNKEEELYQLLKYHKEEKILRLQEVKITDNEIKMLGRIIARNDTIKYIDLSGNDIGNEGLIALGNGIAENDTLIALNLEYNPISIDGVIALQKILTKNTSLLFVNFMHHPMFAEGESYLEEIFADSRLSSFCVLDNSEVAECYGIERAIISQTQNSNKKTEDLAKGVDE